MFFMNFIYLNFRQKKTFITICNKGFYNNKMFFYSAGASAGAADSVLSATSSS